MKKFTLFFAFFFLVFLISACPLEKKKTESSFKRYVSETRDEFGFRGIKAGGAAVLIITVQKEFSVTVEGAEDLIGEVKTQVADDVLFIKTSSKISSDNRVRVKISMPELSLLDIWGDSEATVTDIKGENLRIQTGGSSKIKIDGEVNSLELSAAGASKIDAENLTTFEAVVRTAGASEVYVFSTESLDAQSLGSSLIFYVGKPKKIKQNILGAGEIRQK